MFANILFEMVRDNRGCVREYNIENYHLTEMPEEISDFTQRLGKEYLFHVVEFRNELEALDYLTRFKCNCPILPSWALGRYA